MNRRMVKQVPSSAGGFLRQGRASLTGFIARILLVAAIMLAIWMLEKCDYIEDGELDDFVPGLVNA